MYKYILYIYLLATTTSTTAAAADCTGCVEFCSTIQSIDYTGETILITSPNYPDLEYSTDSNCYITVNNLLVDQQDVEVHIQQQSIVSDETVEYKSDFAITYINPNLSTKQWRTTQRDGELCTVSTDILFQKNQPSSLRLTLIHLTMRPAFNATFTVLPLLTIRSNDNSIANVTTTPTAYVQTHDAFNFEQGSYNPGRDKRLYLLDIPESTVLTLQFVYLNIGDNSSCGSDLNGDVIVIYRNLDLNSIPLFICSDVNSIIPTQEIYLPSGIVSVTLSFRTNADGIQRDGFLLKYSVTSSDLVTETSTTTLSSITLLPTTTTSTATTTTPTTSTTTTPTTPTKTTTTTTTTTATTTPTTPTTTTTTTPTTPTRTTTTTTTTPTTSTTTTPTTTTTTTTTPPTTSTTTTPTKTTTTTPTTSTTTTPATTTTTTTTPPTTTTTTPPSTTVTSTIHTTAATPVTTSGGHTATTSHGTESTMNRSTPVTTTAKEFFSDRRHQLAIGAGLGGLIMLCIIIALTCILYSRTRSQESRDGTDHQMSFRFDNPPNGTNRNVQSLRKENEMDTGRGRSMVADSYESIDLPAVVTTSMVHMDTDAVKVPSPVTATNARSNVEAEGQETYSNVASILSADKKKSVEVEQPYGIIRASMKKKKVEMVENVIYSSRDSLSSQSSIDYD